MKRFFNGMVFFLAMLMFFLVPIGKKTGAQHMAAIFSTKPAHEAAASVAETARKLTVIVSAEITRESLDAFYNEHPQVKDPRKA